MARLANQTSMNFIDCSHFVSLRATFYPLIVVFQLLQSMGLNALFDLPQLFMILLLVATFPFRKLYPVAYGLASIFLTWYIHCALTLKVMYGMLVKIEYVADYIKGNPDNAYVRWCRIIFGS